MIPKLRCYLGKESQKLSNYREHYNYRMRIFRMKPAAYSTVESLPKNGITSSCSSDDDWKKKLIYNEVLHINKKADYSLLRAEKAMHRKNFYTSSAIPNIKPLFLQCLTNSSDKTELKIGDDSTTVVQFPYEVQKTVLVDGNFAEENLEVNSSSDNVGKSVEFDTKLVGICKGRLKRTEFENPKHWADEEDREFMFVDSRFGSCDPNIPISTVPCGGCGALLHCKDMAIPGFLPKEVFQDLTETDLRGITCQRCLFLQEYNVALGINVNPDEYPKILSQIRTQKALVILMVDLLDFPCSIWPNIVDVIGKNKPIFVVGNKMDLIIQDKEEHIIKHRTKCLMNALEDVGINSAHIQHVALISAKTGYGVENLITNLQNLWGNAGDVYIVGCTNAGKSTLFNTLLQSDFCKVKAADVLQRATVSQWPGTTLNLLKFPILKPLSWRKAIRIQRLKVTDKQMEALRKLKTAALRKSERETQLSLMGYIGRSFGKEESSNLVGLDPNEPEFRQSKWCYDTPGVVHECQILNLFTAEELSKVLPRKTIIPRNFKLIPGNALFIGGVARLDLITSLNYVWFTVFASPDLPVTVTNIEDADFIYQKLLGTNLFGVPHGNYERLKKWPKLLSKDVTVVGLYKNVAAADVVLSSTGCNAKEPDLLL